MNRGSDIPAQSVGTIAAAVLEQGGELEVIAVFERSAYVMCETGIVCLGHPAIGHGPIHVLVPQRGANPETHFLSLTTGMKGVAGRRRLSIGPDIIVETQGAAIWAPAPFPHEATRASRTAGVGAVRRAMAARSPADGVAALVFAPQVTAAKTRTAQAAAGSVATLSAALPAVFAADTWPQEALHAAILLVGLGPGLTPSGDDLLGGLMLGLSARDKIGLRDALWDTIAAELDDLTVPPSAMHLSAAADGMGSEVVHDLINAMVMGDTAAITTRLEPVLALGATSGADLLAGLTLALDA